MPNELQNDKFSVYQFLADGSIEYVQRDIDVDSAVEAFGDCVSKKTRSTRRVVILVGEDVHVEWSPQTGLSGARKMTIIKP